MLPYFFPKIAIGIPFSQIDVKEVRPGSAEALAFQGIWGIDLQDLQARLARVHQGLSIIGNHRQSIGNQ